MTIGVDIILDPVTHDLLFRDGDLVSGRSVYQAVKIRLQFFRGEWFANRLAGVPYFEQVFVKPFNAQLLYPIFYDVIAKTPGVVRILKLEISLDRPTRQGQITWAAQTDEGDISGEEFFG